MLSFCYDMLDHPPLYPVHPYLPCLFSHCVATPLPMSSLYIYSVSYPLFASFLLALAIVFFTTSHSVVCLFFLSSVRIEVELLSGIK